jgi:hypothetical protein
MSKSDGHLYQCVDIILNDKNITEKTVILMFVIYKDLLKKEQNEKRTLTNLDKAKS